MTTGIKDIAEKLLSYDEYMIHFHKDPDGDAVGSAYALALALQSAGKKCNVCCSDEVPSVYRYLTDRFIPDKVVSPVNIAVDSAAPDRLGRFSDEKIVINIDHHYPNTIDAECSFSDPKAAACCEIVYDIIRELGTEITPFMADFLYTGIATDTYCFRSYSLRQRTFEICAELASLGANIVGVSRHHFMSKTRERMMVEKKFTDSFRYFHNNEILCGIITLDDIEKANIDECELEGINSVTERITGVLIGITVRQKPDGRCRVSVHTNNGIDASLICSRLGGGGHADAAGCEYFGTPDEAADAIVKECIAALDSL